MFGSINVKTAVELKTPKEICELCVSVRKLVENGEYEKCIAVKKLLKPVKEGF